MDANWNSMNDKLYEYNVVSTDLLPDMSQQMTHTKQCIWYLWDDIENNFFLSGVSVVRLTFDLWSLSLSIIPHITTSTDLGTGCNWRNRIDRKFKLFESQQTLTEAFA